MPKPGLGSGDAEWILRHSYCLFKQYRHERSTIFLGGQAWRRVSWGVRTYDKNLCRGPGSHRRSDVVNSVGKCERELKL